MVSATEPLTECALGCYQREMSFFQHLIHWLGSLVDEKNFPAVLSAIAWPLVIFAGFLFFGGPLRSLLGRILSASWGDKVIQFGTEGRSSKLVFWRRWFGIFNKDNLKAEPSIPPAAPVEKASAPAPTANDEKIDKTKVGDIYWVGADAMNAYDVLLRGGSRNDIVHMFRQVNHHLKQVGLLGDPLQIRVERLFTDAAKSLDSDWNGNRRVEVAKEVAAVVREFGQRTEKHQPGFKGFPDQ
jgi:hypothetical protein